jgi:hypothetical protein
MIINIFTSKLVILQWSQESYYKVQPQATDITSPINESHQNQCTNEKSWPRSTLGARSGLGNS